jgi:hypothetical protein
MVVTVELTAHATAGVMTPSRHWQQTIMRKSHNQDQPLIDEFRSCSAFLFVAAIHFRFCDADQIAVCHFTSQPFHRPDMTPPICEVSYR